MNDQTQFAEQILFQIGELQREIDEHAQKRDASINFYNARIEDAKKIFETDTTAAQQEIDSLTIQLKEIFDAAPPKRSKSIKFAGGTIGYRKQETRFALNGEEVNGKNKDLLRFVKLGEHGDFLKIEESVDWKNLKANIQFDGDDCYLAGTGEIIDGMKAFPQPDAFYVKTKVTT